MSQSVGGAAAPDFGVVSKIDAVIVGAGFAGLYMLHRLVTAGLSARVIERASGVGGTWFWNRYPGARCDIESMQYSYSFSPEIEQEWTWSEVYASQPEILRYLNFVADRLDLRRHITFGTSVIGAQFDEAAARWTVTTDAGEVVSAQFCIMATGCLSTALVPDIAGMGNFAGAIHHTGSWPEGGVDFSGQRVGVIGTGSSGIQLIPCLAEAAREVVVFQRTANFSIPARNRAMTPDYEQEWKGAYQERRAQARQTRAGNIINVNMVSALAVDAEERRRQYEARWATGGITFLAAFNDLAVNRESNETAATFVRERIRSIVQDPAVAELLTPTGYPIGSKRICSDTDYYATYNRPNVTLVDVRRTPITEITATGVQIGERVHPVDSLVFATGFDAFTGALGKIDIRGRHGVALRDAWAAGPQTYLGLMIAGFPNFFTITGPGSPSVLSNMVVSIEQHVEWIANCILDMRSRDAWSIEAMEDAQEKWVAHVSEVANGTLYPLADSWNVGANVPGKPRVFMPYLGGVGAYRQICDDVVTRNYDGFSLEPREGT